MIHYIVPLIFHHPDIAAFRLKRITLNHPLLSQAGHALLVHPQHLAKGRLLHAD